MKNKLSSKLRNQIQEFKFFILISCLVFLGVLALQCAGANALEPQSKELTTQSRTSVVVDMPNGFDVDHELSLNSLEVMLRNSTNTDFVIRLEGLGGDVFLVNDFMRAMEDSQHSGNTISFDVVGIAASGHAYITCIANKVTMRSGSSLLFHQVYGVGSLFFGYVQYRSLSSDSIINNMTDSYMQTCLQNKRLTQKDIDTIKSGDDVILLSQSGKIIKQYEHDDMTILSYTIPLLLTYLSNIMAILLVLGAFLYVWRRVGK